MRIRNRIELAKFFNEEAFTYGAEVGVYKGEYAQILFENIPGLRLLLIDSWASGRRIEAKDEAIARSTGYNAEIFHATSLDGAKGVEDGSLDFVFIDAGHTYKDVKEDVNAWAPKVRAGGIVSGHDYFPFPSGRGGVVEAVNEYADQHGYMVCRIPGDKSQTTDNRQPCWFWRQ